MPKTKTAPITIEGLIERYAEKVGVVADEEPATELEGFISQLYSASQNLDRVYMDIDDIDAAATYLGGLSDSSSQERQMLLRKAEKHLARAYDLLDEYADMI